MSRKSSEARQHPLVKARELRGWSTYELAARSGVAQSTIFRIEIGERHPSAKTLARIARALGLDELEALLEPWVEDES